jgi:hypothetical protein
MAGRGSAANALLTGMKIVYERILSSCPVRAADLIAELNTDSCGLLAAALAVRWPVIEPKLPLPRGGMTPQSAPTWLVVDGAGVTGLGWQALAVWFADGLPQTVLLLGIGGAPVGLAGEGGEVPQAVANTATSPAAAVRPVRRASRVDPTERMATPRRTQPQPHARSPAYATARPFPQTGGLTSFRLENAAFIARPCPGRGAG